MYVAMGLGEPMFFIGLFVSWHCLGQHSWFGRANQASPVLMICHPSTYDF